MKQRSWKPQLCGVLSLLGALIPQFYPQYTHHGQFLTALASGLGLMSARQNNRSSEQVGAGRSDPKPFLKPPCPPSAIRIVGLVALLALCGGCARFHSVQIQTKLDGSHVESRQTITTFWDSQASIAKLRASTTDKTQGLTVGGFAEESSATNAVELIDRITRAAVSAAVNAAAP